MAPLNDFEGLKRLLKNTSSRDKSRLIAGMSGNRIICFMNIILVRFYDNCLRKCSNEPTALRGREN